MTAGAGNANVTHVGGVARPRAVDVVVTRVNGARHNAESNLVTMRAQNPDVSFPPCGCE